MIEKRGNGVPVIMEESRKRSAKDPVYRVIEDSELLLTIYAVRNPTTGNEEVP